MSTYLFIIIAASATRNIGFTLDYDKMAKKAESSLGLGLGVKRDMGPNPFAPKVNVPQKEDQAKINPSVAQQQNKPQPIKVPGINNKPKGPTGVISIFETDEDENMTNLDFLRKKPANKVTPQGEVTLDQNKKPAPQPVKDTKIGGLGDLNVSLKDKDGVEINPRIDFSRMPNRFVLPFGVPAALLNDPNLLDKLQPKVNNGGKLPLPSGQDQKPLTDNQKNPVTDNQKPVVDNQNPKIEPQVQPQGKVDTQGQQIQPKVNVQDVQPTNVDQKITEPTPIVQPKIDEIKEKLPEKKPEVIVTVPQKTAVEIQTQTDFNDDQGIIRPEDLLPKDQSPKDKSPRGQTPEEQNSHGPNNQGHQPDGLGLNGPQRDKGTPTGENQDTQGPHNQGHQPEGLDLNGPQRDKGTQTPTIEDILPPGQIQPQPIGKNDEIPPSPKNQNDVIPTINIVEPIKSPKLEKGISFHDDIDIDYSALIPAVKEEKGPVVWDTDFFKKTRIAQSMPSPTGEIFLPSLKISMVRNQGKKIKKIKRIYLIEVVRCKKCMDDPLIQDFADSQ